MLKKLVISSTGVFCIKSGWSLVVFSFIDLKLIIKLIKSPASIASESLMVILAFLGMYGTKGKYCRRSLKRLNRNPSNKEWLSLFIVSSIASKIMYVNMFKKKEKGYVTQFNVETGTLLLKQRKIRALFITIQKDLESDNCMENHLAWMLRHFVVSSALKSWGNGFDSSGIYSIFHSIFY